MSGFAELEQENARLREMLERAEFALADHADEHVGLRYQIRALLAEQPAAEPGAQRALEVK